MEENSIVKYGGGLIKRISNQIGVTNKLLALSEPQLIPYRKGDKWGFCTADKKILIDCVYDEVEPFSEGLAVVKQFGKYGFIEPNGKMTNNGLLRPFDKLYSLNEGIARARYSVNKGKSKWGFVNKNNLNQVEFLYDYVSNFYEGLADVRVGEKWDLIDKMGKSIDLNNLNNTKTELKKIYPEIVKTGDKYYILDKDGKQINSILYDNIDGKGCGFSNELIDVEIKDKWGFVDKNGQQIIPCIYDEVHPFFEELAGVLKGEYWAFINKNGNQITPFIYDEVQPFTNGLAKVVVTKRKDDWVMLEGYINKYGTEYWED